MPENLLGKRAEDISEETFDKLGNAFFENYAVDNKGVVVRSDDPSIQLDKKH